MALSAHRLTYITAWQNSGLSQVAYCHQHQLVKSTLLARLSEFRAQAESPLPALPILLSIHVQLPALSKAVIILQSGKHRLELAVSVFAS